jgi:hypothetical protein
MDNSWRHTDKALFELQVAAFVLGISECVPESPGFMTEQEAAEVRDSVVREACAA